MSRMTLGVIFGNRDFFPDRLVSESPTGSATLFADLDIHGVMLDDSGDKVGRRRDLEHAKRCADLFRRHADEIDGILVCLPNFGDEKGVADTLSSSGLNVPVLVQAYPDDLDQFTSNAAATRFAARSRSATTCGSTASRTRLTDRAHSHPSSPTVPPGSGEFLGVCRVVNGLRKAPASAPSAPAPARSTPCATARSCSSRPASASRRSICRRCSAG